MSQRIVSGELLLASSVVLLGVLFMAGTLAIPATTGYERIGPTAYPWAISGALIVVGLVLIRDALRSGSNAATASVESGIDSSSLAFVSLGLLLHLLLIERAGFIVASTTLFFCTARAFGARSRLVTACIAVALGVIVYLAFTRGLDLPLPAGILQGFG